MNSQKIWGEKYMLKKTKWTTAIVAVLLGTGLVSTNHVQADTVSDAQSNTQVVQNSNQSHLKALLQKRKLQLSIRAIISHLILRSFA